MFKSLVECICTSVQLHPHSQLLIGYYIGDGKFPTETAPYCASSHSIALVSNFLVLQMSVQTELNFALEMVFPLLNWMLEIQDIHVVYLLQRVVYVSIHMYVCMAFVTHVKEQHDMYSVCRHANSAHYACNLIKAHVKVHLYIKG